MSANTDSYWKKIQDLENNPVGAYQSRWQSQLDNALNAITNRKAFNYDFNADPMYQAYKDQYTKLGKEASMNAAANAAALTGGYGNSYAVTAGAQANQQYLTQLNNIIPELYNLAMNRYKMEGDELNNRYAVLGDADDRDYGRHRDTVGDWKDQLAYLQSAYGTQLANDQWEKEYALKLAQLRPAGGGGGGTRTVYVNGKPVEVDNNGDKQAVIDKLYGALSTKGAMGTTGKNNQMANIVADALNQGLITEAEVQEVRDEARKAYKRNNVDSGTYTKA